MKHQYEEDYYDLTASQILSRERKNKDTFDYKQGFRELLLKDKVGTHIAHAGRDWDWFNYERAQKVIAKLDQQHLDQGKMTLYIGEVWKEFDFDKGLDTLIKLDKTGEKVFDAQKNWKNFDYKKGLDFLKRKSSKYYEPAKRFWPKNKIQEGASMYRDNLLLEMAANHIDNEMLDKMINGEIEDAVSRYINNMKEKKATIARTSSAVTKKIIEKRYPKSLTVDKEKLEQIPAKSWQEFDRIYKDAVEFGQKPKEPRPEKMKGSVAKTSSGEEMITTAGRTQKHIKDDLANKLIALIREREALLDVEEEMEKLDDISNHIRSLYVMLEGLNATRTGRAMLDADPEMLKKRYEKIGKKFQEKRLKEDASSEAIELFNELISATDDYKERRKYVSMRNKLEKILKETKIKEEAPLSFHYDYELLSLMEALEYKGSDLAENYFYSSFTKAFRKDVDEFGLELAEDIYKIIYGDDITLMTSTLIENEEFFNSVRGINSTLLFEGFSLEESKTRVVWEKLKGFGAKALAGVSGAFNKGAKWAKELVKKGASFFGMSSITKIAVPAVVIAGSVAGAVALINGVRKKMKQSPLSKEELEKFKEEVRNNRTEINNYR